MYKKKAEGWLKHLDFLLIDLVCFQLAYWLSNFIRHGLSNTFSDIMYRGYAFVAAVLLIVVVAWTNTFSGVLRRGSYRELISVFKTDLYVMGLSALYLFAIQQGSDFSRIVLALTGVLYFVFAFVFRCLWKMFLRRRYSKSGKRDRLIFVTNIDRVGASLQSFLQSGMVESELAGVVLYGNVWTDISCVGELFSGETEQELRFAADEVIASENGLIINRTNEDNLNKYNDIPIISEKDEIGQFLQKTWIDEVFVDLSETAEGYSDLMNDLMEMGVVTHLRVGETDEYVGKEKLVQFVGGYPVVTISAKMLNWRQSFGKRLVDILVSIFGCAITLIITIIITPIILIKSPGHVYFTQTRIGRNGKRFRMIKFRTMYPDAEVRKQELTEDNLYPDGMMFKLDNDPRIIGSRKKPGHGIGFFLRRTSIDEFPQFFNVLIGNMSLVGTRPPTQDEWEKYETHHRGRMTIKPGITGLWQVSGRNEITDFDEVVRLDCEYIENWSMKLDFQILIRTIGALSKGK
ncbi:MAG: sugar transferase [Eubacterium sp.]|nr:sugar transferase [Eubacterium sp.]